MIVRDIIAFGALYSTRQPNHEEIHGSVFLLYCYK